MFDTAIIHPWHLILALAVFIISYTLLGLEQKNHTGNRPAYAGTLLIGLISVAVWPFIDPPALRISFTAAALLTAFVGQLDEALFFSARTQFLAQIIIITALILGGWTIPYISNPLTGGILDLSLTQIGFIAIPGSLLAFIWLLFLMNSINWIDGNDGLAGSIISTTLAALVAISLLPATQDSQTFILAIIGLAASLAFTIWNFPPAKLYLGTSGSWFLALYTGLVAIQGGGKIVTSLIVLAIPVLDCLFVIAQRLRRGQPIWQGDTESHLHHRLRHRGFSPRHITLGTLAITVALAVIGVLSSTSIKIGVLLLLAIGFILAFLRLAPISFSSIKHVHH